MKLICSFRVGRWRIFDGGFIQHGHGPIFLDEERYMKFYAIWRLKCFKCRLRRFIRYFFPINNPKVNLKALSLFFHRTIRDF